MHDHDPAVLRCRARVATACYNGRRFTGWREDGTYRRSDDTIVCDACYIALGTPEKRYLERAIIQALAAQVLRHGPPIDPTP